MKFGNHVLIAGKPRANSLAGKPRANSLLTAGRTTFLLFYLSPKDAESERKVNYEKVVVTEVTDEAKVFVQVVDSGPKLEELMKEIRAEFTSNPPLSGAYQPKRGDMCAAKFVDGEWYRAKVEKVAGAEATVLYVDYGNRATISKVE